MPSYDELTLIRLRLGRWHPAYPQNAPCKPLICNKKPRARNRKHAAFFKMFSRRNHVLRWPFSKAAS